jgi:hypothetical protein
MDFQSPKDRPCFGEQGAHLHHTRTVATGLVRTGPQILSN